MNALFYPSVPFETLYLPWIYKEIYYDHVYNDVLKGSDMVILDVGANIGAVTGYMRPFAKKIYALEPSPLEFEALKKNKEFNGWDNVEVFPYAIADVDWKMQFFINPRNRTANSLLENAPTNGATEMVMVDTRRLDTFLSENSIENVDFMKLDVEGAEDAILRGEGFTNVADKIRAIEVEFHRPGWEKLSEHLLGLGYHGRRYQTDAILCLYTRT